MMKLFFNICLLNSSSFGAPRNILVSHERIRFLIQAVAETGPGTFANYRKSEVEAGTFCQASSSLLTQAEVTSGFSKAVETDAAGSTARGAVHLPLLINFRKIMVVGTETTRRYLQELTNVLASDEFRATKDLTTEEKATIDTELNVIIAAVTDQQKFHRENAGYAVTLGGKAGTDGEEPKSYLLSPEFKYTSEKHTLEWKSKQTGALEGSRSHSKEGWTKIQAHHQTVNGKLLELSQKLDKVKTDMDKILTEHRKHLTSVTPDVKKRGDVTKFFEVEYGKLKDITPVKKYEQSSGKTEPNIDGFGETEAGELGAYIIDLISRRLQTPAVEGTSAERLNGKDFEAFLALKGSPAETMTRLSTTLNILYVKREAEKSAKMTDSELLKAHIVKLMKETRNELIKLLRKMTSQLGLDGMTFPELTEDSLRRAGAENTGNAEVIEGMTGVQFKELAKVVYDDITRYPKSGVPDQYGVQVDDSDKDAYVTYMGAVTKAMGEDAIAEVHPRINLLFNVARRLHINMIGFVHALGDATPLIDGASAGELQDPYTWILRYDADQLKSISGITDKDTLAGKKEELKLIITSALKNARSASDCLLYGRYDALMRNLKRAFFNSNTGKEEQTSDDHEGERKWCTATRQLGQKNLDAGLK